MALKRVTWELKNGTSGAVITDARAAGELDRAFQTRELIQVIDRSSGDMVTIRASELVTWSVRNA